MARLVVFIVRGYRGVTATHAPLDEACHAHFP